MLRAAGVIISMKRPICAAVSGLLTKPAHCSCHSSRKRPATASRGEGECAEGGMCPLFRVNYGM